MVLGLLFIAAIPTTIGTVTGVANATGQPSEEEKARDEKRGEETHLVIHCSAPSPSRKRLHGKSVLLRDNKVFIATLSSQAEYAEKGHPFKGFMITFPGPTEAEQVRGLVSMCSVDPPAMGWIFADKTTGEMRYGNKSAALGQMVGPWDLTEDDEGVLLGGEEAFVGVRVEKGEEKGEGLWQLFLDLNGDGSALPKGKKWLPVSVERRGVDVLQNASKGR